MDEENLSEDMMTLRLFLSPLPIFVFTYLLTFTLLCLDANATHTYCDDLCACDCV